MGTLHFNINKPDETLRKLTDVSPVKKFRLEISSKTGRRNIPVI